MGIRQVPDRGKTPLPSARFAPAGKQDPATSPRPALYADSFPKLDAIGACRQDVVQISLTIAGTQNTSKRSGGGVSESRVTFEKRASPERSKPRLLSLSEGGGD